MKINNLSIENLRNISHANLSFESGLNIVTGANGAGKTSLLESFYLLARAKSFRQGHQKSPIKRGTEKLILFANAEEQDHTLHKIGFLRTASETQIKLDGQHVRRLTQLAQTIPIALITPQSHRLIEEGPEHRRRILNWGVFHVEHNFANIMKSFSRALIQRNNALRNGSNDLSVWDHSFVKNATLVNRYQTHYMDQWIAQVLEMALCVPFLTQLEITFQQGWKKDQQLDSVISEHHSKDRERGFTSVGPHRADIELKINGVNSRQTLSRGQQKILVTLLLLAQARLLEKHKSERPIFLYDDLESELDDSSIELLCDLIDRQQSQTFISSLHSERLTQQSWTQQPKVFHVEHGHFD